MINREENTSNLGYTLDFLTDLFNHPATSNYFYTNDLVVLVDIVVRQLCNIDDSSYELRYAYFNTLSSLMNFSQYGASLHKLDEIRNILKYTSQRIEPSDPLSSIISNQASILLKIWNQ